MSKSLRRVQTALETAGLAVQILEVGQARTAQEAADSVGCHVDQIAKSIIFAGQTDGRALLFLTAGGNRVDPQAASVTAGQPLQKADAALIRAQTGFAIGGVSPIGHLSPISAFWDPRLSDFEVIYAAAGTPRHVFAISPAALLEICGAQVSDFTSSSQ